MFLALKVVIRLCQIIKQSVISIDKIIRYSHTNYFGEQKRHQLISEKITLSTITLLLKDYCSSDIVQISVMSSNVYQQLIVRPCIKSRVDAYIAEKCQTPSERTAPSSLEELEKVRNNPFGYLQVNNDSRFIELSVDTALLLLRMTVKYLSPSMVESDMSFDFLQEFKSTPVNQILADNLISNGSADA